jgi:hypothetical protein
MIVRDKTLGRRFTGTIASVALNGRTVQIAWHGTIITEEWEIDQLDILS